MKTRVDERGQALPLAGILLMVMVGALLLLSHVTQAADERIRARIAADAAALAGAAAGEAQARAAAVANGAELVFAKAEGNGMVVRVRVGDRQASARAERTSASEDPRVADPTQGARPASSAASPIP